jgi:hypothetical protein
MVAFSTKLCAYFYAKSEQGLLSIKLTCLDVVKNVCKYFLLCYPEVRIVIVGMGAVVNDAWTS